jgi:hypothetical protein
LACSETEDVRVIVVGGTGRIRRFAVSAALAAGHDVGEVAGQPISDERLVEVVRVQPGTCVHPRIAQELLRHASSNTTMEIYSHVSAAQ